MLLTRSGKVVRINSREPIPVEFVDLDGVHDLETSVADDREAGPGCEFTECMFTFTGDINTLLARLPDYEMVDVSIEEAPFEDGFLRFYGEEAHV